MTYSRLSSRGGRGPAERQEPFLEARKVPYADGDLRAYDPDRAAARRLRRCGRRSGGAAPGRGRRRGVPWCVLVGVVALAAGMVILAYAYGIATRVDAGRHRRAPATAPENAAATRGTLPADDAARSIPASGARRRPCAGLARRPAWRRRACRRAGERSAAVPAEAVGSRRSGRRADGRRCGHDGKRCQPALVAPVPATTTPPRRSKSRRPRAEPPKAEPPTPRRRPPKPPTPNPPKAADNKPANSSDDLMANIERLLKRDGATAAASDQPGTGAAAMAGPTPIVPARDRSAIRTRCRHCPIPTRGATAAAGRRRWTIA